MISDECEDLAIYAVWADVRSLSVRKRQEESSGEE